VIAKLRGVVLDRWGEFAFESPRPNDISIIQRSSTWLGAGGKVVFLLFRRGDRIPFAVAKIVRDERYKHTLQKEFDHLSYVWKNASAGFRRSIPQPILLECVGGRTVYMERALKGKLFPQVIKQNWGIWKKKSTAKILEKVEDWLVQFYSEMSWERRSLSEQDVCAYFMDPMEAFSRGFPLTSSELKFLNKLQKKTENLVGQSIPFLPQHGDFWGGSILLDGGEIRVIDWEFFKKRDLPLLDWFMIMVHPGFSVAKQGVQSLLSEFGYCFKQNLCSDSLKDISRALCDRISLNWDFLCVLFPMFLITLASTRDMNSAGTGHLRNNRWKPLFSYYVQNEAEFAVFN